MAGERLFRVGIVQFDVKRGRTEENLAEAERAICILGERGAKLALLPEMWSCGFDNAALSAHAGATPNILGRLSELAAGFSMVISGTLPERWQGRIYNTAFVLDESGALAGAYRKIHLFSASGETRYYAAGRQPKVCETAIGRIGLMTCYDIKFPELGRALTDLGAEMVLVSAQWPRQRIDHWDVMTRARAIENQLFVLGANRCGNDILLKYPGQSRIVSPMGKVLAQAGEGPQILTTEIDMNEVALRREEIPALKERVLGG